MFPEIPRLVRLESQTESGDDGTVSSQNGKLYQSNSPIRDGYSVDDHAPPRFVKLYCLRTGTQTIATVVHLGYYYESWWSFNYKLDGLLSNF